jgi:hypothetical protein
LAFGPRRDRYERWPIACPSCGSSFRLEAEPTTATSASPGQKVGRFDLLGTVGQGAFGTVFKARDPDLDRTVALKVPRPGNLPDGQDLDRFLREARSAAQLRQRQPWCPACPIGRTSSAGR